MDTKYLILNKYGVVIETTYEKDIADDYAARGYEIREIRNAVLLVV